MTSRFLKSYQSFPLPAGQSGQTFLIVFAFLKAVGRFIYTRISDEIVAVVFAVCFFSLGSFIARDFSASLENLSERLGFTIISVEIFAHAAVVVSIAALAAIAVGKLRGYLRARGFDVSPLWGVTSNYIGRVLNLSLIQSDGIYAAVYFASLLPVVCLGYCIALGLERFIPVSLVVSLVLSSLMSSLTFGFWLSYFLDHMWWHRLLGMNYQRLLQTAFSAISLILIPPLLAQFLCVVLLIFDHEGGGEFVTLSSVILKLVLVVGLSTLLFPTFALLTEPRRGFSNGLYAWMFVVFSSSLMMFSLWLVPVILAVAVYTGAYQSRYFARI